MYKLFNFLVLIFSFFIVLNCAKKEEKKEKKVETILKGTASILVDETLVPIIEDQIDVFESYYDAKLNIVAKSELEVIRSLVKQENSMAILTRELSDNEKKVFEQKKIIPRTTKIAIDAIAFIANKNNNDTLIALKEVISFIQGQSSTKIKGLVFDNPNSSTVRFMNTIAGTKTMRTEAVYSFKTNEEVIKFVSENIGMIGVVGVNWLSQPSPEMQEFVDKVNVLSVKSLTGNDYSEPTQNDLAEGKYPLARDLYIINCQGNSGLGMGFASFVAGDIGQRIILKSGLLPIRVPGRRFNIRKEINNK
jgi:phosphate transport system substrate-binding protein